MSVAGKNRFSHLSDHELEKRDRRMQRLGGVSVSVCGATVFGLIVAGSLITSPALMICAGGLALVSMGSSLFSLVYGMNAAHELKRRHRVAAAQTAPAQTPAPGQGMQPVAADFNPAAAVALERDIEARKPLQLGRPPKQLQIDF